MKTMKAIPTTVAFIAISLALTLSAQAQTCGTVTWNLTAGQNIYVGTVTANNDMDNLYITYTLDPSLAPGATLGNLHLWVGNNLLNMPQTMGGIPIPGQFCSSAGGFCYDATGLTTSDFTVPFTSVNLVDASAACNSALYVVAHAEVLNAPDGSGGTKTQTAFGGNQAGSTTRWWFYGVYTICCDFGPPTSCLMSTAFAKGGWVWVIDKKSNPEQLPSLKLTQNRWGWAINLTPTDINITKSYDIWAGAALNNTKNGKKVGILTVFWDGSNATLVYTMLSGYYLVEVHIYANDFAPASMAQLAPGSYGYPSSGYDVGGITTFSTTVPLGPDRNGDGVWLIGHANVTNNQCR